MSFLSPSSSFNIDIVVWILNHAKLKVSVLWFKEPTLLLSYCYRTCGSTFRHFEPCTEHMLRSIFLRPSVCLSLLPPFDPGLFVGRLITVTFPLISLHYLHALTTALVLSWLSNLPPPHAQNKLCSSPVEYNLIIIIILYSYILFIICELFLLLLLFSSPPLVAAF